MKKFDSSVRNASPEPPPAAPRAAFAALEDALPQALEQPVPPLRAALHAAYRRPEVECVASLLAQQRAWALATDTVAAQPSIDALARHLVDAVRGRRTHASGVDALMQEFSLSSAEGVALMCLAEALLSIPDRATADRLIADKLGRGDWRSHLGHSPSLFVNAATWGLLITGKLVATRSEQGMTAALTALLAKGGEPLVRKGVALAMQMLGNQFVAGQTIDVALANSAAGMARGYRYSYDMLGEAAITADDAQRYCLAYENAIHAIGAASCGMGIKAGPGISVKLSALHPRYGPAQRKRVVDELLPRLKRLVLLARQNAIGINIDAEEADRLELSFDLLERLAFDAELAGFDGIGFVVQAYQKRCPALIDCIIDLARRSGRKFMVRLVKGAYWDTEIKRAQVDGMIDYPVYTRKVHTDISYLVCAAKLLDHADLLYPQFATHNAQTLATIHVWANQAGVTDYEFQCLHGMGEPLYDEVVGPAKLDVRCRIYAPVGPHRTLLAYLVRRLLENGANSSFVNRLLDPRVSIDALVADPFAMARASDGTPHPQLGLPAALFGPTRSNSSGIDFSDAGVLRELTVQLLQWSRHVWHAHPLVARQRVHAAADDIGAARETCETGGTIVKSGKSDVNSADASRIHHVRNPANHLDVVGQVTHASANDVGTALDCAAAAALEWQTRGPVERACLLRRAADLIAENQIECMALLVREAGKSLPNAVGEIREAIDFLRFYAAQAEASAPAAGLGSVVCISPWNFPLAIFIGQIGAALAAGNTVLAKPAEQTSLIAFFAVSLLHRVGIPTAVVQLLPGSGIDIGAPLIEDPRVRGVLFTGSTGVAQSINRALVERATPGQPEPVLIAETGGQNAMIVDASALAEQVVPDVLMSAFDSAGQRCSALRVLCLQEEIADTVFEMLIAALRELRLGPPDHLAVDVGPMIDGAAAKRVTDHVEAMRQTGARVVEMPMASADRARSACGTFIAPTVIELPSLSALTREVFGPVLHVVRYRREDLGKMVDAINRTGYGLTLGIHSRIDETIAFIAGRARVGNVYVNRNTIGAVVGSQPFGGRGLSGTGPKAGGPLYLSRLQARASSLTADHVMTAGEHPNATIAIPAFQPAPVLATWRNWLHSAAPADAFCSGCAALDESLPRPDGALLLPGPTGERNRLFLVARGTVLCLASTQASLLQQLDAVFSTGNVPLLGHDMGKLLPNNLPDEVRKILLVAKGQRRAGDAYDAVLIEGNAAANCRKKIAEREGELIPVIVTAINQSIPLLNLVYEKTITENTTAAGGNAGLMSLST